MAHDKSKTGPQDASRGNIHKDYEVADWTKKWGVTRAALEVAVKAVGTGVTAVAEELGK